jgi:hypothetical protein
MSQHFVAGFAFAATKHVRDVFPESELRPERTVVVLGRDGVVSLELGAEMQHTVLDRKVARTKVAAQTFGGSILQLFAAFGAAQVQDRGFPIRLSRSFFDGNHRSHSRSVIATTAAGSLRVRRRLFQVTQ